MLEKSDLNHEIIYFAKGLMQGREAELLEPILVHYARGASTARAGRENLISDGGSAVRLARNAMTLLYHWLGRLPEGNWRDLVLDRVNLVGADLTAMDFSGSSLRNAVLDNAVFTDANFQNADLTGVRFEETGEVVSLSIPAGGDSFLACYRDGKVRRWTAGARQHHSDVVSEHGATLSQALQIGMSPQDHLCVYDASQVSFADRADDTYKEVSRFKTNGAYDQIIISEDTVVTVEQLSRGQFQAHRYRFCAADQIEHESYDLGQAQLCDFLGDKGLVLAERGKLVIQFFDSDPGTTTEMHGVVEPRALAVRGLRRRAGNSFIVACGQANGYVGVWECRLLADGPVLKEIFNRRVHDDIVTCVAFLDDHFLLSGSRDKHIHRLCLQSGAKKPLVAQTYELRVRCRGMKIEGVRGEKERTTLEKLLALG